MNREQFLSDPDIHGALQAAIERGLKNVLEGGQEDLRRFASEIAMDAAAAALTGDQEALRELRAQTRALAEANRLRAVNAAWTVAADVVGSITGLLLSTAAKIAL